MIGSLVLLRVSGYSFVFLLFFSVFCEVDRIVCSGVVVAVLF